jgi:hypothetical protein
VEYLLRKIYLNPKYYLKNLTTFQLHYFYDYFQYESSSIIDNTAPECVYDKQVAIKISKHIRKELRARVDYKPCYKHIH